MHSAFGAKGIVFRQNTNERDGQKLNRRETFLVSRDYK